MSSGRLAELSLIPSRKLQTSAVTATRTRQGWSCNHFQHTRSITTKMRLQLPECPSAGLLQQVACSHLDHASQEVNLNHAHSYGFSQQCVTYWCKDIRTKQLKVHAAILSMMGMQTQQNADCCLQAALHLQTISTIRKDRNTRLSAALSASSSVKTHAPVLPPTTKELQEPAKSFESNLQGLVC